MRGADETMSRANLRRRLRWLWLSGTLLWVIGFAGVIYDAYQEPHDLWLFLDQADARYDHCWPKASAPESITARRDVELNPNQYWYEAPWHGPEPSWVTASRIRRVATCVRTFKRLHQTTNRTDVLVQGIVTMVGVPALVFAAGWLFFGFTSYPKGGDK
jgi:hypothetical protein